MKKMIRLAPCALCIVLGAGVARAEASAKGEVVVMATGGTIAEAFETH